MEEEQEDFSKLSTEDKVTHKVSDLRNEFLSINRRDLLVKCNSAFIS